MAKSKRSNIRKKMRNARLNDPEFKEKMRDDLKKMLTSTENGGINMYVEPEKEHEEIEEMMSEEEMEINKIRQEKKLRNQKKYKVGKRKVIKTKGGKSGSYGKRLLRLK